MQLLSKSHPRFWIGRLPQHCAPEHSADIYIAFNVAHCAGELATIPQCANNHPGYLVARAQVPEHYKRRTGIFALPNASSVTLVVVADALSDLPQAVMASWKAMELVFLSLRPRQSPKSGHELSLQNRP